MKEMCNDFIPDMEDMTQAGYQQVYCGPSTGGNGNNGTNGDMGVGMPELPPMGVMDCNTCVIEAIGLAQAFVPFQPDGVPMGLEESLICGTAFAGLVKPYAKGSSFLR